jgi:HTH-type transcriptional regulator / antitoxin HigA
MDIRPIHTDADHAAALKEIERLWNAADGSPEADRLEVLAILVEDYESRRWPVPQATPVEILHYAISDMGRSQADLAALIGSRSRASEILNGKRRLTMDQAHKISTAWHIPAELLIAPYRVERAA